MNSKSLRALVAALLGVAMAVSAQAAFVTSAYHSLGSDRWTVDFAITATPEDAQPIREFTIYFPLSGFADLMLTGSADGWDSLVIPGDPMIPADGFFDALAVDPADALIVGQRQTGFSVAFTFLTGGLPPSLSFEILDEQFAVVGSGRTVALFGGDDVATVPEPATAWLLMAGLSLCWMLRRREKSL